MTVRRGRGRHLGQLLAVMLLLSSAASASADRITVVGTITGTIDGTPFELDVHEIQTAEGVERGATVRGGFMNVFAIQLVGQREPSSRGIGPGGVRINFLLASGLRPCPCIVLEPEVTYSPDGRQLVDVYASLDAQVEVTGIDETEPGVVALAGTFSAELGLVSEMGGQPDPGEMVTIEGSFDLPQVAVTGN